MSRSRLAVVTVLICCVLTAGAFADQKVKTRMSVQGNSFDSTSYVKGQRMRDEQQFGPMTMITIQQCDLNQTIQVNERTKTYMIVKEDAATPTAASKSAPRPAANSEAAEDSGPTRAGGTITITTSVQDTGETKDFFGYKARHVKSSMSYQSSPDACNAESGKMETDGWYINFEPGVNVCARPERQWFSGGMGGGGGRGSRPQCQDKVKYSGPGMAALFQRGYPVDETMTISSKDGKQTSMRRQAVEISRATLDAGLFEPPAGYRQVSSYAELMGLGSLSGMMAAARAGGAANRPSSPSTNMNVSREPAPTPEVAAKQPGKIRIGVAAIKDTTGKSKIDGDSLRSQLIAKLQRFDFDVVPAEGADDDQVKSDAKQKDCDYVLFTDASAKDNAVSGKKVGGFLARRMTGGLVGSGNDTSFDGSVAYRLFKIAASQAALEGKQDNIKGATADEAIPPTFEHESRDVAQQIMRDKH